MRRLVRLLVRLTAALLAVSVLVVGGTAFRVWQFARDDSRPRSDAILVLGAAQFDGRPSAVFAARLRHAQSLFLDGVAPVVVTVGGKQPGDRFSEGGAGRTYLLDKGLPAAALVAVESGGDTVESLAAASVLFQKRGWTSVVLVTDPYHSLRSRAIASDLGLSAAASPTRQGPSVGTRATQVRYVARETVAYLYYRVFGRGAGGGAPAAI